MKRWLAAAVVATLAFPHSAEAAPGGLDPSFAEGGVVTTDIGRRAATANAVLVEKDGRMGPSPCRGTAASSSPARPSAKVPMRI